MVGESILTPEKLDSILERVKDLKTLLSCLRKFGPWFRLSWVKEKVRTKLNDFLQEGDTIVTDNDPDKRTEEIIKNLKQQYSSPKIKQFYECLGKHWSLPLIEIGLHLHELTEEKAQIR